MFHSQIKEKCIHKEYISELREASHTQEHEGGIASNTEMLFFQFQTTVGVSICDTCKQPIEGKKLVALDKTWHPHHFLCKECNKPITGDTFNVHDGLPYCEDDFNKRFRNKCAHCNKPITDKFIRALEQTWHPEHFMCTVCQIQLVGKSFLQKDGKAFCETDYHNSFSPRCHSCDDPIRDAAIVALGQKWHQKCFTCVGCKEPVEESVFCVLGDRPLCSKCPKDATATAQSVTT